jgi:hypothetical protein
MACRSQADANGVPSFGFETKGLIESGHLINACQGNIEAFCYLSQGLAGKMVHPGLDILKDTDEGCPLIAMLFNNFTDYL